jgi:AraC-like DNA-binding protein
MRTAVNQFQMQFAWIGQTAKLAARSGFDVRTPLAEAGVSGADGLLQDDSILDPAEFLLMCGLLINAVDDELHGIARTRMARGTHCMALKTMASAKDFATAIDTIARFFKIIRSFCRINFTSMRTEATVQISAEGGDTEIRPVIEELLAHALHIQFCYFLGFFLPLNRFQSPSARHPHMDSQHPYLLCPVRAGAVTSMVFPTAYLGLPSKAKIVDQPQWDSIVFWLSQHRAIAHPIHTAMGADALRKAVLDYLHDRDATLAECSADLSMSLGELKRGLFMEGTSFRKIRRAALIERARPHLVAGASTDDLSYLLGYSDSRSFRRALKLATGLTISELRVEPCKNELACNPKVLHLLKETTMLMCE